MHVNDQESKYFFYSVGLPYEDCGEGVGHYHYHCAPSLACGHDSRYSVCPEPAKEKRDLLYQSSQN